MTKSRLYCSCGGSEASTWEHLAEEQKTIWERQGASSSITDHSCLFSIQTHKVQWCDNVLVLGSENTRFERSVGGIWDCIYYILCLVWFQWLWWKLHSLRLAGIILLSRRCVDDTTSPRSDLMIVIIIMISTVLIMIIIMTIIKDKRELIPSSRIILLSRRCVAEMIRNHRDDDYCDHQYSYHSDK